MATLRNSDKTPAVLGARATRVQEVLTKTFAPQRLEILDESHRHAHHAPMVRGPEAGASETHFRVQLVSAAFEGVSRVNRSRMVHAALGREFETGLHALALSLRTPEEDAALS